MTTMQISTKPNKSIMITGANSGLGYYCARAIATSQQNWHIIIASRDASRIEASVDRLRKETEYPYIEGMTIDLASLASIRQFAEDNKAIDCPPLEAIVCNAGIQIVSDTLYTKDGFEMTFGVNHLGHFLLVNLLLPRLSAGSRIVFVSSDTHNPKTNTGMPEPQYQTAEHLAFSNNNSNDNIANTGRTRYTTSKLCNILACYELSRRLQKQQSKIAVNAFNPGLMLDTKLARDYSQAELSALSTTISPSVLEKARDSKTMGAALARLILDPLLNKVTGKYFDGLDEIQSSDESYDQQKAASLWDESVKLVNLSPEEAMFLK